ncbi:MAG: serine/threonine protein phosphatase [Azospirillum sp.]|nr:serine/threonine protein phosphatase [Azospirillum sp.]
MSEGDDRARSEEGRKPRLPEGLRLYAVGDIHGRSDLLAQLLEAVEADAAARPNRAKGLVFLGDYVDRGSDSKGVIDRLIACSPDGFRIVYLRGNHEDLMLRFLADLRDGAGWLTMGGKATLESYGLPAPVGWPNRDELAMLQRKIRWEIPPRHLDFLNRLKPSFSVGDYFFVHAGIRPGVPFERQASADLLWIRDPFLLSSADHGKVVVHGHTIAETPEIRPNRIGIDTGAFATGRLTCLVLEGDQQRFLST